MKSIIKAFVGLMLCMLVVISTESARLFAFIPIPGIAVEAARGGIFNGHIQLTADLGARSQPIDVYWQTCASGELEQCVTANAPDWTVKARMHWTLDRWSLSQLVADISEFRPADWMSVPDLLEVVEGQVMIQRLGFDLYDHALYVRDASGTVKVRMGAASRINDWSVALRAAGASSAEVWVRDETDQRVWTEPFDAAVPVYVE